MSARAKLDYVDASGKWVSQWLQKNQRLVAGSSNSADLCLQFDENVAPEHCEFLLTPSGCEVRGLAPELQFTVGDDGVVNDVCLDENATIKIGRNIVEVGVSVETDETEAAPTETHDEPAIKSEFNPPPPVLSKNGVVVFEIDSGEGARSVLIERVLGDKPVFLAINFRAIGKDPQDHELEDHFSSVAELSAEYSMSIAGPASAAEQLDFVEEFFERDCGILLVPRAREITADEFLAAARILLGWWVKPSVFDFNMRSSGDFLPKQIFEVVDLAAYFLPGKQQWVVTTHSEKVEKFSDLASL